MPATDCYQRYLPHYIFSVSNLVYFSSVYRSPGSVLLVFNTQYRTSDISENLGRYVSSTEHTAQERVSIDSDGKKQETRHPVEGQFGSEFLAIHNHCRVTAV